MPTIADFEAKVATRIQDAADKLAVADRDDLIVQAITERYSKDAPQEKVADQPGDGSHDVSLPADFEDGFSIVEQVEYPVGDVPENILANKDYRLYRSTSGLKLRIDTATIDASETVRITYTAKHASDASTVRDSQVEAVADYASSLCCDALAAIYAQTGDASITADSVNYRTKSQEYQALAKRLAQRYYDALGVPSGGKGETGLKAAIAMGDLDESLPQGVDRLTHSRRDR